MKSLYKNIFTLFYASLGLQVCLAQGICNDASFEKGDFDLSNNSICLPSVLKLTDKSGAKNVRYVYNYQSEDIDEILLKSVSNDTYNYIGLTNPKIFTVLQVGEKNNKISIACKNVTVRPNNTPVFSFTACNVNSLEVNIPKHPLNDFDNYSIELGAGQAIINISKNDLPYGVKRTLSLPRVIRVSGSYSDASKSCPSQVPYQSVPTQAPYTVRPFFPTIEKIELLTPSKVKINYIGPYPNDPDYQAKLYFYEKNNWISPKELKANIIPGEYEFPLPDSTKSYCFYVNKNSNCGIGKDESPEICTHPLKSVKFSPLQYDLLWETYPTKLKGFTNSIFTGNFLNINQTLSIKIGNSVATRISVPSISSQYVNKPIDCKKRYCYQVEQNTTGFFQYNLFSTKSISNKICVDRSQVKPPAITDTWVSTDPKNIIKFENDQNWPLKVEKWLLFKEENKNYLKIDSSTFLVKELKDTSTAKKSESYKVGYRDECNSVSSLSPAIYSLYLDYSKPAELNWSKGAPFSKSKVSQYAIIALKESDNSPSISSTFDKNTFSTNANLDAFEINAKFRIEATSETAPKRISLSNSVSIPIPTSIYLPSTFTPNGDNKNDILTISGKTKNVRSFSMQIYNRYGQQIAELSQLSDSWNGTQNGKALPIGMYLYKINAKLENGEVYKKTGAIEILK